MTKVDRKYKLSQQALKNLAIQTDIENISKMLIMIFSSFIYMSFVSENWYSKNVKHKKLASNGKQKTKKKQKQKI